MSTRSSSSRLRGEGKKQRSRRPNANKPSAKRRNEKQQLLLDSVAELLNRQLGIHHFSSPSHPLHERQCYRPYSSAPPPFPHEPPQSPELPQDEQTRRSQSDGSRPTTLVNSTGSSSNLPSNLSSPCHQDFDYTNQSDLSRERTPRPQTNNADITATDAFQDDDIRKLITRLAAQYGHVSHMGVLDRSYRFFVNGARTGTLSYKLQNQVAIVAGDPLCDPAMFPDILHEFKVYRKRRRWGIVIMGTSEMFIKYSWRHLRSETTRGKSQAFITIYDPFCLPDLTIFIYARGSNGAAMGFAALRRIRDNRAYHLDPCVAAPWALKGISELLTYASMTLLHQMEISSLSFGYEPLQSLGEMTGISPGMERVIRRVHHHTFRRLPLAGKKAYHDKFRPD